MRRENKRMIITEKVKIDSTLAELYLEYENEPEAGVKSTNRKHSATVVNTYAAEMLLDNWAFTHQGIGFTGFLDDGTAELVDGGHRLRALIQAAHRGAVTRTGETLAARPGISIEFMVTQGLTDEVMKVLDIGRRRVPADFLKMDGEVNVTTLSGVTRISYAYLNVPWRNIGSWRDLRLTPTVVAAHLQEYPQLRDAVKQGIRLQKLMTPTAAGVGWFLANLYRPDVDVDEFMDMLNFGEGLSRGMPAYHLRELMLNSKAKQRRWEPSEQLAVWIKAFNRWASGQQLFQLAFRARGENPEEYPRISKK